MTTWTLREDMVAVGEEVGDGMGMTERTAMSAARAKAQDVKKPKAFWMRVRVLCMLRKGRAAPRSLCRERCRRESCEQVIAAGPSPFEMTWHFEAPLKY